ncbi:MAG: hypothetical protein IKI20_06575 [Lachnospiraceae bacterium]|nr:hypothetical protein [Lachnospiraceae bacterium]
MKRQNKTTIRVALLFVMAVCFAVFAACSAGKEQKVTKRWGTPLKNH